MNRVTSGDIDPERLALLLEGKLAEPARSALLARLALSAEDIGIMADAASIAAEVEASPSSLTARSRWPRWFDRRTWYALAAAILIVAALPIARVIQRRDSGDATSFASIIIEDGRAPAIDAPFATWPATRSAEGPVVTASGRSVRLGARSTDLEIAIRTGDPRLAGMATDMAMLLDQIPGASPVAEIYRSIATAPADRSRASTLAAQGGRAIRQLPGDSLVVLGAWVEAARIAASQRDTRFFERPAAKEMITRLRALPPLPDSSRASLSALEKTPPVDQAAWQRSERLWSDLLLALGS